LSDILPKDAAISVKFVRTDCRKPLLASRKEVAISWRGTNNLHLFFSFQKAFKQIAATLKLCFTSLSTFVLEFVIVFAAFCWYFFFMLSPYMTSFRSIPHSVENTIAMAIGKFSFATIRAASNFAAWIFFLFSGQRLGKHEDSGF
jgi:hypothetical protein